MNSNIGLTGRERVLVIRTDRIGDLVLTTPVFEALKRNYPGMTVDALVSDYARPVLENNPHLRKILTHSDDERDLLLHTIYAQKYALALVVYPRFKLAWLAYRAGIPVRIGTAYRWYSFLFTHKIYHHRRRMEKHEVEYNLDLLTPLGIRAGKVTPRLYLSKNETDYAEELFRRKGIPPEDLTVVIHPGGGRSSLRWKEAKFGQLASRLVNEMGAKIILTGIESERNLTEKVSEICGKNFINLAGQLSLRELAAILSKVDLVVTNSTGPLHMTAALGTKAIGLFCPIKTTSPTRWGPYGEGHATLLPPVESCNCSVNRCKRGNCMELITVEQVLAKAESALKGNKSGVKNR